MDSGSIAKEIEAVSVQTPTIAPPKTVLAQRYKGPLQTCQQWRHLSKFKLVTLEEGILVDGQVMHLRPKYIFKDPHSHRTLGTVPTFE